MREFADEDGRLWEVTTGKESWGTLVLLFIPVGGGDTRVSVLDAETMRGASAELDAFTDEALRLRLADSRPWS